MTAAAKKRIKTLDARTLPAWRRWLDRHHASQSEIWLVFHKRHTGTPAIAYDDAVCEALCYGWIDSLIKRLDDERYALRFMPRNPRSAWSTLNRRRYARLKAAGRLKPAGIRFAPTERSGDRPEVDEVPPPFVTRALQRNAKARAFFESLAPSYRRMYLAWILSAKREETRARRLAQAIDKLAAGRKPGLE